MFWIIRSALVWFGNLPLKTKLYMSFGWMCLFTVVLGAVSMGGIHRVRLTAEAQRDHIESGVARDATAVQNLTLKTEEKTRTETRRFELLILFLLSGIVVVDLLMAWRLTHLIGDPVLHACAVLEKLSHCDLTVEAQVESKDEVGQMCSALNQTILKMHQVLSDLSASSGEMETAAQELHDQTVNSSDNCNRQVELAREVLRSTQQLANKGEQIAQNSTEAAQASRESTEAAQAGNTTMLNATKTMQQVALSSHTIQEQMNRLNERSREINRVVSTIQEISEDTNLLALNASIEAARAGEHGRGFAVVATEVRRLAEHTHKATVEIGATVESILQETANTISAVQSSQESIETGQKRTEEAHQMLSEIIRHASHTETLAEEASQAADEQSSTSQQIATSAAKVAELAEASLHASGEVSKTGSRIHNSAHRLNDVVKQFRL